MATTTMTLRKRVIRAGGWTVTGFVTSQVIRLGGNLVLTRLLFPEAFGLMAIVYVLMAGLALFSDLGINQSIIQNRRGDSPEFLNTAWVVQILRGVLIWVAILLIAYSLPAVVSMKWVPAGSVYADPLLPSILTLFSFTSLIQGFESTKFALAQRMVQLKRVTFIELFSQITALLVMLIWVWLYPSIWALVGGAIVSTTVRCVMGHLWLPGPANRFGWDSQAFKEIFHFGKWIFLLSLLGFLFLNGDRLILGGMLDATWLGVYSIAYLLSNSAMSLYSSILSRVLFPALSEVVQNRPENLRNVYQRIRIISDFSLFGVAGFLLVAGEGVVSILYDARYHGAGNMLSILALSLIGARYAVIEFLWMAKGHMRYLIASNFIRLLVLYAALPLGYRLAGMEGALYGISLSFYAAWPVVFYYKAQHGLLNWWREFAVLPVFLLALAVGWLFMRVLVTLSG
ncbi:polysaccharide biosynthesis protein [Sulfuricella sp. T08]|uniref:oligosaccharide flippase family protein n=1 Tax=Sulfuricella sp. T08 TaxID=1632857 RepID=UPI000617A1EC|nr:oligosaccharide flippase family protein [Sulfuricella sp. T08]GAO34671.1 polysaccharide biosynthesis protein [Sulfuricella sp. T08]